MTALTFVAAKATGLDPAQHEIWELAIIRREDDTETEHVWQLPVDLTVADPLELEASRFADRRWPDQRHPACDRTFIRPRVVADEDLERWSHVIEDLTSATVVVVTGSGAPHLDLLRRLLQDNGACPRWHTPVDATLLAAGWVVGSGYVADLADPPWNLSELSRMVGVEPAEFERHTALGIARWTRAIYDATTRTRRGRRTTRSYVFNLRCTCGGPLTHLEDGSATMTETSALAMCQVCGSEMRIRAAVDRCEPTGARRPLVESPKATSGV